ncbi:hypothetical protein LQV05_002847 [Cryptococcus neoformans]|nr:hypothetical protein C356_05963 [Cryptococcus neoformans var. grubii c45]OXB34397.1 hypothetical protein J007_05880 [Cryptococcus neoformans var. grubii]OXC58543.1 hypothetical protein C358_05999 [Cryptococcus neoformans var. grubii MW-RSA852]UOH80198.1 hypothetical protein LQV05_002847 [Cryptococcus neoformans]
MTIIHVVAFKTATPSTIGPLTTSIKALKDNCINPRTGKPYILDLRGGKQISTEGLDRGMKVVFVMEFENDDDLQYYLYEDPAHDQFKKSAKGEWEAIDVIALDFSNGEF